MGKNTSSFRGILHRFFKVNRKYWRPIILVLFVVQVLLLLRLRLSVSSRLRKNDSLKEVKVSVDTLKDVKKEEFTVESNYDVNEFIKSLDWELPLPPNEILMGDVNCESWLKQTDMIDYGRDFKTDPVLISGSEEKLWTECAVGCQHTSRSTADIDGSFAFSASKDTMSILRSMEPRAYYPLNDVKAATDRGFKVFQAIPTKKFTLFYIP